jgi:hypothetical protein
MIQFSAKIQALTPDYSDYTDWRGYSALLFGTKELAVLQLC